jgi:hypothetical protein
MNLFSQKGIQAFHRILKEKYDDRKKLSPNVPPSGGLAYQQTVEQVLAHAERPAVWIVQRRRRVCKKQGRTRCRKKGKPAWLRFWPILMMC